MLIQNISFFVDPAVEKEFLEALRREFIPALSSGVKNPSPRLFCVNPGVETAEDMPRTYSLQISFPDASELASWQSRNLQPVISGIGNRWAEKALCMASLLEPLSLEP